MRYIIITICLTFNLCTSTLCKSLFFQNPLPILTETEKKLRTALTTTAAATLGTWTLAALVGKWYTNSIQKKYETELFIMNNNLGDDDATRAEIIRYILKNYLRQRWFKCEFTNYPLLTYVCNLDRSIFRVSLILYTQITSSARATIRKQLDQLKLLKKTVIGDCGYVQEQVAYNQDQINMSSTKSVWEKIVCTIQ